MSSTIDQLPTTPKFLLASGLLIWGWQTEFIVYAVIMALLLELSHWSAWRWPITDKEINNIADLSGVIFFIVVVYIFINKGSKGIFIILSILPFILFLLMAVQRYSEAGKIKLSALFVSLRRIEARRLPQVNSEIDISLPYLLICLISASSGNRYSLLFFFIISILVSWMLWLCRSKRYSLITWAALLTLSLSLAYAGQIGMVRLQRSIESAFMQVFDRFAWRYRDPNRTTTAIGSLGRLKLSDRILLRVKTDTKLTRPLYLREAVYNHFEFGVWKTSDPKFTVIDPDSSNENWILNNTRPDQQALISTYMINEAGVVPLPLGTSRIKGPGIIEISRNSQGTVSMDIRQGWISYQTEYQNNVLSDNLPNQRDLFVKGTYLSDFNRLVEELALTGKPDKEVLATVEKYFADNFYYSLEQKHRYPRGKYLSGFLFEEKKGHCEFFATATVLLLRAAGIPARYAVGYVVSEYSQLEGQYIARARDAHSWVLAYVNGAWRTVDTTPAIWAPLEAADASAFQPLMDLWAWLKYRFSRWQSKDELAEEEDGLTDYLLWLLIPLVAVLAWRLYLKERIDRRKTEKNGAQIKSYPGMDSSFYLLAQKLEGSGLLRRRGESLRDWIIRIEEKAANRHLMPALQLHYRYRFDPAGDRQRTKAELDQLVGKALDDLA